MRRRIPVVLAIWVLALFCVTVFTATGFSAGYPTKPITLIVPWGAGGNADVQARLLVKMANALLPQPIVVKNRPGGGTIPGVTEALQAAPDGHTLIWIAIPSVATQPYLKKTPYTYKDLTPIVNVSQNSLLLYVRYDSPWYTLEQFLEHARKNPVNISCNGIGALPHLAGAELAQKSKAKMKFLPYESSAHAVVALLGGHMDAAVAHELQAFTHGDKLRALAVFEPERVDSLKLVPTAKEQGYDIVGYVRDGVAISSKAPKECVQVLGETFKKSMESDEFKYEFLKKRIRSLHLNSEETLKLWISATESYSKIIKELGLGPK
ncbi:MAG: tripartite tricarboxylate transporter substrate binding protein [Deltaproteobacteria bacterium]|nr:tripartite tricarboxylate transporter substrate binding protein [Deltaproteobacteria bacterium]